jgi:hypothetical protein
VQIGGRRRVLASAPAREALVDRVLAPLFARYGRDPLIHAWDLINEPEWATIGLGTWNPFVGVQPSAMRRLHPARRRACARAGAAARHGRIGEHALAALLSSASGSTSTSRTGTTSSRLATPLATPVSALACDRPVVLGEFPTNGSAHPPERLLETARQAGYHGRVVLVGVRR